jgi:hypothetical protein
MPAHPGRTRFFVNPAKRTAKCVLADDPAHPENLRADAIPAQCGHVRVALVTGQYRHHPRSEIQQMEKSDKQIDVSHPENGVSSLQTLKSQ